MITMKLDLHFHSKYSLDSNIEPKLALKIARENNLGLAITDHNSIGAWNKFKRLNKKYKVPLVYGEEIKAFDEKNKLVGEFLAFFIEEEIKSSYYFDIIDEIKSQQAIISVAHPFDYFRAECKILNKIKKDVHLIEVFNARCFSDIFNDMAHKFALQNNLGFSAGSDAHSLEEIGRSYLEINFSSLEEVQKELSKKKQFSFFGKNSGLVPHLKTNIYKLLKE